MKCMLRSHKNINELLTNSSTLNGNILYCYIQKYNYLSFTKKVAPFNINDLIYLFSDLNNYVKSDYKYTNIDDLSAIFIGANVNVITFESLEEMFIYIRKVNNISFLA